MRFDTQVGILWETVRVCDSCGLTRFDDGALSWWTLSRALVAMGERPELDFCSRACLAKWVAAGESEAA
jgi:hypothetical protein